MSHLKAWHWIAVAAVIVLAAAALWALQGRQAAHDAIPAEQQAVVGRALDWLRGQQNADGSYDAGFGHPAGVTCDAVLAVAAAGEDATGWVSESAGMSMTQYLTASAHEYAVDAASSGKLVVALSAAGLDPRNAGGDWVAHLQSFCDGSGTYDVGAVGQAWAILALAAAGEIIQPQAVDVLKAAQLETGAWASAFGVDNDTVAYAMQALMAAGEPHNSPAIQQALSFLHDQQNDDGGFPAIKPSEWGTDTNANSTANVIMALHAVGEDPTGQHWARPAGNPVSALVALQAEDGRIEYQPGTGEPLLSTVQAIPALMNCSLPFPAGR
jgi:hypothetical protein